MLGPLEVVDDGRNVPLGSGRQLALLAVLLLNANETVSVDRLVSELWEDVPPPTASKIVRNYISVLRRELADRLVTRSPGYLLRVEKGELDSERLEQAVEGGDCEAVMEALALWRGPPLAQLAYERFAQNEIARLDELHLTAVEARIECEFARGRHASVAGELEALVRQHPLRERLVAQLMLALYRSGRQAESLEVYRQVRRSLDEQLGIDPGPVLRELERKILNQDESLAGPRGEARETTPRRRRGLLLIVAAGLLLLAAAGAAAFLATREVASGLSEVRPNHVGMIDPATGSIIDEIPVGIRPGPVVGSGGSIWVGNLQDRNLTKIDSRQRRVVATVSLDNRTPTGIAAGSGDVWVAFGPRGELARVDAEFGRITRIVAVTTRQVGIPSGAVALGAGYVWAVYGDSTLARLRRNATHLSGSTLVGSTPTAIVVAYGAVWVANSVDATVQRFAPRTFDEGPVRTISVGRQPTEIAFGRGSLWVANSGDDSVSRIDPSTGSTITIRVGDRPSAVAVGAGSVWVANTGDRTVSRVDPATNEVIRTIAVGNAPAGIAVADGLVWVTAQAP